MMLKHILVPLDGSKNAEANLSYARALAEDLGARVTLLRVVPPIQIEVSDRKRLEDIGRQLAVEYLQSVEKQLRAAGINVDSLAVVGDVAETIAQVAQEVGADAISIGSRGVTARGAYLLGSVTLKVLQIAPCPVIVTRVGDSPSQGPR